MKLIETIETFISGDWGNESHTEDTPCEVFCVRGADIEPIKNQDYNHIPKRYISKRSYENKLLQVGDIIVEKSGGSPTQSTGRVCLITPNLIEKLQSVDCSNFCAAFRVKKEWDAEYIYLYIQHFYNMGAFFNFEGKTSGIKNLQLEQAYQAIEIKPISIAEQKKLAKTIRTIDGKTAINRSINQNLTAMAKQLYDYWFVQFDFPLEKVYSFEPTAGISPEDQKYVIGAQANLWTEYIPTFSQVEYMIMPRIDAVADIQWSDPSKKDYQTFLPRVARMTQLYDRLGYNYGKHIFDINASLTTNTENGTLDIALTKLGEGDIYYTVDGSDPTIASIKYEGPVQINQDCEFKAIVVRPNGTSRIFSEDIFFNKATMKPITLKEQPSKGYVFNGAQVLVDGLRGGSNYKTGHWLGFQGKDLDATIDLKESTEIQKVSFNTNVVKGDWIMGASAVTVKVSDDGKNFKEVASKKIPGLTQNDKDGLYPQEISFAPVKARHVEVIINSSKLPKWHGGAGSPAFLFVDEIEIL